MTRYLVFLLATLLIGALLVRAKMTSVARADLTYVNPSGIHTLDPARMSWTQDFRVALNIWEGLSTWDPMSMEPIAGAARIPPGVSADGLTYTFTIREDARWSNGDPVTAGDFLRGWRRGMEPGASTDYTFFFTDNIAGAAEYVHWRRGCVRVLTALKRLGDGWDISAEQARAIAGHELFQRVGKDAPGLAANVPRTDDDAAWNAWAKRLPALDVDWAGEHLATLRSHAAEMEKRFAAVAIDTPDDRTLVVGLSRPCPYFLDLAAMPIFLPCHKSIELLRERFRGMPITAEGLVVYDPQWTKPDNSRNGYPGLITNGPYRLTDWIFKRRARLAVNPYYRGAGGIACRTVDMVVFDNISASIMAYEAGDVDFLPAMDVPYDHEIARLARSGERPDFHLGNVLATYFLNFNCVSKTVNQRPNPFLDRRIRKAFALAIDKKRIVKKVLNRGDRVAGSFVPPGTIAGYDPPTGLVRNVDEARRLLSEAGHPGGTGLVVELLYTSSDERVCQALARMWEESLGAVVRLRSQESKTFAEDKANHRYMIARGNWYADYNDPTTFLDCLSSGNGNNDSGYTDAGYDALLAQAASTRDTRRRAAILRQAETIIVEEDLPILPILHYAAPIAIKSYVHGLHPNPRLWFPFRYVTVER